MSDTGNLKVFEESVLCETSSLKKSSSYPTQHFLHQKIENLYTKINSLEVPAR